MIRKLMASSAVLALVAAGGFSLAQAQDQATETQQPAVVQDNAAGTGQGTAATTDQEAPAQPIAAEAPTLTPDEPTIATAFIGRSVYSSEGENSDNIGSVNDLIIGSDGKITHAVVGVGGFLGIGEKNVAVPFDQLQVVQEQAGDVRLIYAATREQLESAEAFDRTAFDPEDRVEEEQAAADNAAADAANGAATTGTGIATAPGALPGAATDTNTAVDPNATAPADQTATNATQTTTTETPVVTTAPADANAVPTAGGFVNFSADQIRASDIIGEEVYGAENESIGEVADIVLQPEGNARVAVVDVGGFLGMGEKRVAIPFDQIKFMQDAPAGQTADGTAAPAGATDPAAPTTTTVTTTAPAADGTAAAPAADGAAPAPAAGESTAAGDMNAAVAATPTPRLTVAMTRQQLEQAPAWQDTTEPATNATGAAGGDAAMTGGAAPAAGTDMAAAPAAVPDQNAAAPAAGTDPNAAAGADTAAPAPATAPAAGGTAAGGAAYAPATQDLSAEDLMGSAVFSSNEDNLGEVGDVIFDKGGSIQAVVVDVGGFLGIGEKPVAVQFDALNVQKDTNGDVRLMVNATQEQLEAAPAYDEDAGAATATGAQPAAVQ